MALLRRARKDVSMAALVEAHRRHVALEEQDDQDTEQDTKHQHQPNHRSDGFLDPQKRRAAKLRFRSRSGASSSEDDDDGDDIGNNGDAARDARWPLRLPLEREAGSTRRKPSAHFSESDTITVAGSDDTATPDSQGFREYDDAPRSHGSQRGLFHYTPPLRKHEHGGHDVEPSKSQGSGRGGQPSQQHRSSTKVSSALMKPMQMMRDRGVAQRRARRGDVTGGAADIGARDAGGEQNCDDCKEIDAAAQSPVQIDALGVVKVDAALIRYIDETLVKPNDEVFNRYTRFFLDRNLERIYQDYTAVSWFSRARWHIMLLMLVHLLVMLLFLVLPPSGFQMTEQFILSPSVASTYIQWFYLPIAIPFAFVPRDSNPFQKRWRVWACAIVVLFNFAFQVWLVQAGQLALHQFGGIVENQLQCGVANTSPVNTTKIMRVDSNNSGSGSAAWVEVGNVSSSSSSSSSLAAGTFKVNVSRPLSAAELAKKTRDQKRYVLDSTGLYAGALLQVLTGFSVLFVFILAISIRLEFVYMMVLGFSALVTYAFVVLVFAIHVEWLSAFTYAFSVVLLFIQSRSADVTNRRSFLSKFVVEKENESLQSSLHKAEAALLNGPAGEKEKEVVEHVLDVPEMQALEAFRIPFADLKFFEAIGRGAMGDVIKAKYLGTVVVCKRIRREHITEAALESFREEIALMACLRHPNIVQFIGASWDNYSNLCIVMEYLENGDVHSVLNSSIGKSFTWADPLLRMAVEIVQGMLYLHSQEPPIVHRDLKSVNVLCSKTYGCNVGDFGLSRRYKRDDVNPLKTIVGTPFWLAPEIIRSDRYGPAADVYSFGIVLTELETRKTPYHELMTCESPAPRLQSQSQPQHPHQPRQPQPQSANPRSGGIKVLMRIAYDGLRPTLPASCLPVRRKLITDCLLADAKARPSFAEILVRLQGAVQREVEDDATRGTGGCHSLFRAGSGFGRL